MADEDEAGEAGDAAQAFEDLRAEVSVLRRAVEALPGVIERSRPPDYAPTLAGMLQQLQAAAVKLAAMEQMPALRLTPADYGKALGQACQSALRPTAEELRTAAREMGQERQKLEGLVGKVRSWQEQRSWLWWVGGLALVVGLAVAPLLASQLPFGGDRAIAAWIIGGDRWKAGMALMQSGNPDAWEALAQSWALTGKDPANQAAIKACRDAAAKDKKVQRCTISVPAPE